MRKELELIERIENYLLNKMSTQEKTDFEAEMRSNPDLKKKVELQESLTSRVNQMAIQNSAKNAHQAWKVRKLVTISAVIVGVFVVSLLTYNFWPQSDSIQNEDVSPVSSEINEIIILEENDSLYHECNEYLPQETFKINQERDTIIESNDGVVVFIPAHSFFTANKEINFVLQSALSPEEIIYAGLNTKTLDGQELETGGMFYFDAFSEGKRVALQKELIVDLPSDPSKTGMNLYDGVITENKELLWTNPKELQQPLVAVDILDLDFYPPGYENWMDKKGYVNQDFKDSLYYFFAFNSAMPSGSNANKVVSGSGMPFNLWFPYLPQEDGMDSSDFKQVKKDDFSTYVGVDPASVKTIWNEKFKNTNLATKEFEERMPYIHKTCETAILELYIKNLDKTLSEVDMIAYNNGAGSIFKAFAAKNHGKVDISGKGAKSLNGYYEKKRILFQKVIARTNESFWIKQDSLDKALQTQTGQSNKRNDSEKAKTYQKELKINTQKVYNDLGIKNKPIVNTRTIGSNSAQNNVRPFDRANENDKIWPISQVQQPVLRATVTTLGWKNIDCLMSASLARNTVKIKNGNKTSELTYDKWEIQVKNSDKFSRINTYNVPDGFNSYVKLTGSNGKYNYNLNADLSYNTVIIGWNENDIYYLIENSVAGSKEVELIKSEKGEWKDKIGALLPNLGAIKEEISFIEFAQKDIVRKNKLAFKQKLRGEVHQVIFPCVISEGIIEVVPDTTIVNNFAVIDCPPPSMADIFTPNGDGKNDFFGINFNCQPTSFELTISNAKGVIVFSSTDPNFKWSGEGQPEGKHVVTLIYSDSSRQLYKFQNILLLSR